MTDDRTAELSSDVQDTAPEPGSAAPAEPVAQTPVASEAAEASAPEPAGVAASGEESPAEPDEPAEKPSGNVADAATPAAAAQSLTLKGRQVTVELLTDDELRDLSTRDNDMAPAYAQMLAACEEHPDKRAWYAPWAICLKKEGTEVGMCGFTGEPVAYAVKIQHAIYASHEGHNYGAEAVSLLGNWAFSQPGIYFLEADAANEEAGQMLSSLGFRTHGKADGVTRYVVEKPANRTMGTALLLGAAAGMLIDTFFGATGICMILGAAVGGFFGWKKDSKGKVDMESIRAVYEAAHEETEEELPEGEDTNTEEDLPEGKDIRTEEELPDGKPAEEELPEGGDVSTEEELPAAKPADEAELPEGLDAATEADLPEGKDAGTEEDLPEGEDPGTEEELPEGKDASTEEELPEGADAHTEEELPGGTVAPEEELPAGR